MMKHILLKAIFAFLSVLAIDAGAADALNGKAIYDEECGLCHNKTSPKIGDANEWAPLFKGGLDLLYVNTIKGKGKMDPRGGNDDLTDAQIQAAVDYMVVQSGGAGLIKKPAAPAPSNTAAKTTPTPAAPTAAVAASAMTGANAFNRLMRAPAKFNLPPAEDGIHDPAIQGARLLQPPLDAFAALPKSTQGNRVDWSKALIDKQISPRSDRRDPNVKLKALDSQIVREVKGSMTDVVFPHKTHAQWLACANCHPAIFASEVNASTNRMSMASIMLGEKCGVCHGTVAFPVSECRRCHSKNKPGPMNAIAKP